MHLLLLHWNQSVANGYTWDHAEWLLNRVTKVGGALWGAVTVEPISHILYHAK